MDFKFRDYSEELDKELLTLFYKSVYYNKKEYEYYRLPESWLCRYRIQEDYLIKLLCDKNDKIIASLGLLIWNGKWDEHIARIGCFVDNCIDPLYLNDYQKIFKTLFRGIEEDARGKDVHIILGWEFLKKINRNRTMWRDLGYDIVEGFNWYPGGFGYKGYYPYKWNGNINLLWRLVFNGVSLYHYARNFLVGKIEDNIIIRMLENEDVPQCLNLFKSEYSDYLLSPYLNIKNFKDMINRDNIQGIVAEKEDKIIGCLTFITSAWSGWMYGKPHYDDKHQIFFTFTPDDFVIQKDYKKTNLASKMIMFLLRMKSPSYNQQFILPLGFVADVFDKRVDWRRKALLDLGFLEAKADFGGILIKSLKSNRLDLSKQVYLPARYILAPVLASSLNNI